MYLLQVTIEKADIVFFLEHPSERVTDIGRFDKGCSNLVDEGWEEVIVIRIDKNGFYTGFTGKRFGQVHTGKTTTNNDYSHNLSLLDECKQENPYALLYPGLN
ncbi:hypothetical protein D3C86_1249360 [compost metagenome]